MAADFNAGNLEDRINCYCCCPFRPRTKSTSEFDLFFFELVGKRRHVAAHVSSIHDRVEDAFVADFSLPLWIGQIARVAKLTLRSLRLAVIAMTRDAIAAIQLRRRALHIGLASRAHGDQKQAPNERDRIGGHHNQIEQSQKRHKAHN